MALQVNPELAAKVAQANRILYKLGILDGFGHISARMIIPRITFYYLVIVRLHS